MKFKEPLELKCPHCQTSFQAKRVWIMKADSVCPECNGELSAIRNRLQNSIDENTLFWHVVFISFGLEDYFSTEFQKEIRFQDEELESLHTVSDVIEVTVKMLARSNCVIDRETIATDVIKIIGELDDSPLALISRETRIFDLKI